MRSIGRLITLLCLAGVARAGAATLVVDVVDGRGAPVSDAVVTLWQPGAAPAARRAPIVHTIDQRNETYIPYVEVFRPGDRVLFTNSDITRHHVYSFSPAGAFEFVLAPGQRAPPLTLERAGVVAVGCNIHDHMIAYLYVTDARFMGRVEDGHLVLGDIPAGDYAVRLWHPQLRRQAPEQSAHLAGADPPHLSFSVSLLPDPRQPADAERSGY